MTLRVKAITNQDVEKQGDIIAFEDKNDGHASAETGVRVAGVMVEAEDGLRLCAFEKLFTLNFSFQSNPLDQYDHPRGWVFVDPRFKG